MRGSLAASCPARSPIPGGLLRSDPGHAASSSQRTGSMLRPRSDSARAPRGRLPGPLPAAKSAERVNCSGLGSSSGVEASRPAAERPIGWGGSVGQDNRELKGTSYHTHHPGCFGPGGFASILSRRTRPPEARRTGRRRVLRDVRHLALAVSACFASRGRDRLRGRLGVPRLLAGSQRGVSRRGRPNTRAGGRCRSDTRQARPEGVLGWLLGLFCGSRRLPLGSCLESSLYSRVAGHTKPAA